MEDRNGSNRTVTPLDILATQRNDYAGVNGAAKIGKIDNESLVVNEGQAEVEVKTKPKFRIVIACIFVLLILALITAVVVLLVRAKEETTSKERVCYSSNCVVSAAKLINKANLSADPCVDFYEYACGGWRERNFIPESKSEWNGFTSRRETIENIVKRFLDSKANGHNKGGAISKVLSFYSSCTNTTQLDALGAEPLKELLKELGSWPLLNETWSGNRWDIEGAFASNHAVFFSYYHHERPAPIFNSYVKVDEKNSSTHIISVSTNNLI